MRVPDHIPFFDSPKSEGDESYHQQTFFNWLRKHRPDLAAIAVHIENETGGRKTMAQHQHSRLMGQVKGACDIVIPAGPAPLLMELKVWSGRLSREQIAYLTAGQKQGAFACVAVGAVGALNALHYWLDTFKK